MAEMTSRKKSVNTKMLTLILFFFIPTSEARIHKLSIKADGRQTIDMTTFGFLHGGTLSVEIYNFAYISDVDSPPVPFKGSLGFSVNKVSSSGVTSFSVNDKSKCPLTNIENEKNKKDISVIFFKVDFNKTSPKIYVSQYGDLENSTIVTRSPVEQKLRQRREATSWNKLSDEYLLERMARRKRAAIQAVVSTQSPTESVTNMTKSVTSPKPTEPDWKDIKLKGGVMDMKTTGKDGHLKYSVKFQVYISTSEQEGLYNLYFHNCEPFATEKGSHKINFTAQMVEVNPGPNYLSAGEQPLPTLYFSLCVVFFCIGCFWWHYLRKAPEGVFKIHYLMLVLIFFKCASLLFHAVHYFFIAKEGHHQEAFSIIYYITHLMKGALLFITIVLIGAGWTFVKHILSDRDKKIFMVVIPLQVLANVARIIIEETEEGQTQYYMWKELLILVDLICCGTILFPVVWSIRHLQDAANVDGKAAINLQKLKIFRHFYIMIVCYIYFTRIIVYLLKITLPFQYDWIYELFKEAATLVFYLLTGYFFRPTATNPYLQLSTDSDEELDMDEVLTTSGVTEGLKKVNVKIKDGSEENKPKQRESSHEYD